MKRLCVLGLLLLFAWLPAAAKSPKGKAAPLVRFEWGLHAGAGLWGYGSVDGHLGELKGKMGWQAGISAAAVWGRWFLQPEIRYVHNRAEFTHPGGAVFDLKSNVIEVPILVSVRIARILHLNVGPVVTVMDHCEYTGIGDLSRDVGRTRSTLGYAVGTAVRLGGHWTVDLRYTGGFRAVKNELWDGGPEIPMRGYAVQLSAGYVF